MVQLIQGIIDAIRYPSYTYFVDNDNVDPNVVHYFKTEYGKHWQDALNDYLHNKSKNQTRLKEKTFSQPPPRRFIEVRLYDSTPLIL